MMRPGEAMMIPVPMMRAEPMMDSEYESQVTTNYQDDLALMDYAKREDYSPPTLALKAMNFPCSKIIIGKWTRTAVYPEDLKVKLYFANRKLLWETLDEVRIGTQTVRRKRKMEIKWADILSLKRSYNTHNNTGLLEFELGKPPKFCMEFDPKPGKATQWNEIDDFTPNQDASTYRRHTLYFDAGVLQENFEKLLSGDNFWSRLIKADNFPTLRDSLCFYIGYSSQGQPLLFFGVNNNLLNHHSQAGAGEGNINMATTQYYGNDGRSMKSFVQDNYHQTNTANLLFGTQVIQPSSQMIDSFGSKFHNPMIQDQSQMGYKGEELLAKSNAQGLLETQTSSMMFPQTNQVPLYPQVGSYNVKEDIHLDDNFQLDGADISALAYINDYDKYFNHGGSMPPN